MKKHFKKVLEALKTSMYIKALGFIRIELKGVAAKIADKLDSEIKEDASDEEVQEIVDEAIDAALPFLQFSQTVLDSRVQAYKEVVRIVRVVCLKTKMRTKKVMIILRLPRP